MSEVHVVLFEPEIPQNTGNIARTCACTGATLHLVEPMGFRLTQRNLGRAGLDYWDKVTIKRYACTRAFLEQHEGCDLFFFTGRAQHCYADVDYGSKGHEVYLVFGRESRGIDHEILDHYAAQCVRIPMGEGLRSLNVSNSVALGVYEVLRQRGFPHLV
ncbi:MAG: tRNA (cytidine(34)-2'-O)-methyltransferase [Raoultibacter sp.]